MAETAQQTSINLPQIIAVALVGFFAVRWFLSKPSTSSGSSSSARARPGQEVDPAKIAQVAAMFPQLDPRSIAWDLNSNGHNVAATTERILSGRNLDTPPSTYRPRLPGAPTTGGDNVTGGAGSGTKKAGVGGQQDLITRYGLQGRLGGKGKEKELSEREEAEERKKSAQWSADKVARAEGLKRRREEMVLAARRRMEAKGEGA